MSQRATGRGGDLLEGKEWTLGSGRKGEGPQTLARQVELVEGWGHEPKLNQEGRRPVVPLGGHISEY